MFEWGDVDQFSFDDSDRFDEDSVCSWISEPESVLNNWRGWRKQSSANIAQTVNGAQFKQQQQQQQHFKGSGSSAAFSLTELAAKKVAWSLPFEVVELYDDLYSRDPLKRVGPVPEELQKRIAFWSFPDEEEDIRLYSCLANGSSEEFNKGEHLYRTKSVKDPLQIGFHLSANIIPQQQQQPANNTNKQQQQQQPQSTSVTFDRKKIVSCQCSCNSQAAWCSHVVALCLHRIHQANQVPLRAPVSESLAQLHRDQLQKFAQYLIAKLPEKILPVAQQILDDLLTSEGSDINAVQGAPDPTLGGEISEAAAWCLDAKNLKENIYKILVKFCLPAAIVFSDVSYLSTSAPPSASEWSSFLRPLRGREPEGMWNLLSIVREMYRRNDRNCVPLLEIVSQQCLERSQIVLWWFNSRVALHQKNHAKHNVNSNSQVRTHAI